MPLPVARTGVEAVLFLALLPCERCGTTQTPWRYSAMVTVDGDPTDTYAGECGRCGLARDFTFTRPAEGTDGGSATRFGGDQPSELLDAGQWMDVAGAASIAETPGVDLGYALDAYREALKFIPPGAGAVPPAGLFSTAGRVRLASEPLSLTRDWIQVQIDTLAQLIAERRGDPEPATAAPPEQPQPWPRSDHPEDLERARRWLLDQLIATARTVHPAGNVAVERDDGPVRSGPDRYLATIALRLDALEGWAAADAVTRAGQALAEAGWVIVPGPPSGGQRWAVAGRRAGFQARAVMSADDGVLRLSGETPAFLLPSSAADAAGVAGTEPADEPWRPANPAEQTLEQAYRRGDLPAVHRLLREVPWYVPVAEDAFGAVDVDGEVYLAAYTSPDALSYGLGAGLAYRQTGYRQLAGSWPNPGWRLAVNAGTPIEVYLGIAELTGAP